MPRSPKSDNSGDEVADDSLDSDEQDKMKMASDGVQSSPRKTPLPLSTLQMFRSEGSNKRTGSMADARAFKTQSLEVLTEMISIESADTSSVSGFDPRRWIVAAGLLEKRRDGRMREGWAKRFFVLGKTALYYYLLPKADASGYAPLLGDERGWIRLTDIQDVQAHARDSLYWYLTVIVSSVRKNNASQYFSEPVSQLQLRTPAETGQLWLDAITKARDDARSQTNSPGGRTGTSRKLWSGDSIPSAPPILTSQASSVAGDDSAPTRTPIHAAATAASTRSLAASVGEDGDHRARRDSQKLRALDLIPLDQSFPLAQSVPFAPFLLVASGFVALAFPQKFTLHERVPEWVVIVPYGFFLGLAFVTLLVYYELSRRAGAHDAVAREAKFRIGVMRDEINALKKAEAECLGEPVVQQVLLPATNSEIARIAEECKDVLHVAGTSTKYTTETMRPGVDYMCWNNALGENFKLRIGPDYKKNNKKAPSKDPLYTMVALDLLRSTQRINNVGGCNKIDLPPHRPGVDPSMDDVRKAGLPRLIIVNAQIPEKAPGMFGKAPEDAGFSLVFYFTVKPETVAQALGPNPHPSIKLVQQYAKEHSTNPDIRRRFKAIGIADNVKELGIKIPMVMGMIERFNGKPVIINKVAQVYESEMPLDWLEIDISIFDFPYPAKSTLSALRDRVSEILLRAGFVFQGETDDELPECLLGGADMCGLDFRLAKVI